jgi:hypothetical protein
LQRRASAVSALVQRANRQLGNCTDNVEKFTAAGDAAKLAKTWGLGKKVTTQLRAVLIAIPAHELGSFDLALGIHQTIDTINLYDHCADAFISSSNQQQELLTLAQPIKLIRDNIKIASETFSAGMRATNALG